MQNLIAHNRSEQLRRIAIARASLDIKYWFDEWVWTYDPRTDNKRLPFILYPKQAELLDWLQERLDRQEDGVAEKSRDMGFTWLSAGFLIHKWLFTDGFKGAIGSRKENLVDTVGDPDSIFEKMRMLLRGLPGWMMPQGFSWKKHDNYCKLINPANGSTITGESGDNIGRGGRNSIYIIDEAAFIERPKKVEAALSQNASCRIYISTPNGLGNPFAEKRFSGEIPVFTMHWKDDPRKNAWEVVDSETGQVSHTGAGGEEPPQSLPAGSLLRYPWYETEKKRLRDPIIIAQEIDIDYTASLEGVTIPAKWVQAAVDLNKRINLPKSDSVLAGLDVADGGGCDNVLTIRRGIAVTGIHSRGEGGTTDTANWALDLSLSAGAKNLLYDAVGVGAGISGTFKTRARDGGLGLIATPVNVGSAPSDAKWPSGKTSKEMFKNLKAEIWWIARSRFEKTYEFVVDGVDHPLDELISIPNNAQLITQLSNVLHYTDEAGKLHIESKQQLAKRGVASPDYAESFLLTFAPARRPARMAVGGDRKLVRQYIPR